tara:strand:- start:3297 stop:4034 length:738 start_codon:yes stop_codon:yes gene_type:complete
MSATRKPETVYYPGATTEYGGALPTVSSKKPERNLYIKEVLDWVILQLAVTSVITIYAYANRNSVIEYINKNPGSMWLPIIASFITLFGMYWTKSETTKKVMFGLFTIAMSIMVAVSVLSYAPDVVCKAVITTFVMVIAINRYSKRCAEQGKSMEKLSEVGGSMLLVLIVLGILQIFIRSSVFGLVICILGVGVFTILLIVDLNRLYDKNDDFQEDPMLAAVGIYLDIINLFLYLLELYDRCSKK